MIRVCTLFMTLPITLFSPQWIDWALLEAATDFGAKAASVLRRVILPQNWPGVLSGCILVFSLSCIASLTPQLFGVWCLVFGGPSGILQSNVIASQCPGQQQQGARIRSVDNPSGGCVAPAADQLALDQCAANVYRQTV